MAEKIALTIHMTAEQAEYLQGVIEQGNGERIDEELYDFAESIAEELHEARTSPLPTYNAFVVAVLPAPTPPSPIGHLFQEIPGAQDALGKAGAT